MEGDRAPATLSEVAAAGDKPMETAQNAPNAKPPTFAIRTPAPERSMRRPDASIMEGTPLWDSSVAKLLADETLAWNGAADFVDAVLQDLQALPEDSSEDSSVECIECMNSVPQPWIQVSRAQQTVFVSQEHKTFWDAVITQCDRTRVCVVGSPGVGKSTTTAYAIRLLLQRKSTVVYNYRTKDNRFFYLIFIPSKKGNDKTIRISLVPQTLHPQDVVELADPNAYYICDPGVSPEKTSCDPHGVAAHVIIVASADSRHWGGDEFGKLRPGGLPPGVLMYFPLPTTDFIRRMAPSLNPSLDENEIDERLYRYGRIPRHIVAIDRSTAEEKQSSGITRLTVEQTRQIMRNTARLRTNEPSSPSSGVLSVMPSPDSYFVSSGGFVSDYVAERVATDYYSDLWNDIWAAPTAADQGRLFEIFLRARLAKDSVEEFTSRRCCGKSSQVRNTLFPLALGGCTEGSQRVHDIAKSVKGSERILFHSTSEEEPFIDMIYRQGKTYYAIQATVGKTHDAARDKLLHLIKELSLKEDERLEVVYAVPDSKFTDFVTTPVEPQAPSRASEDKVDKEILALVGKGNIRVTHTRIHASKSCYPYGSSPGNIC